MNWFIAKLVRSINGIIGIVILITGFSLAYFSLENKQTINTVIGDIPAFILIILGTLVILTIICGLIALLSQIETHLEVIRNNTKLSSRLLKEKNE